jgi:hypothetical protein
MQKLLLKFENFRLDYLVRISRKIATKKSIEYTQCSVSDKRKRTLKLFSETQNIKNENY